MDIITFAQKSIGVPFITGGRDFTGWDCWGLVFCAYREVFNINLPPHDEDYSDVLGKEHQAHLARIINSERHLWRAIKLEQSRAGDVILMKISGRPTHVGLLISKRDMLHVDRGHATARESFCETAWVRRTEGFYRYIG